MTYDNPICNYENTRPIHRKIYDVANMEMYELCLEVKRLNPRCKLVGIKTDCLVFNNAKTDMKTSNEWGCVKKCAVPPINQYTLGIKPQLRSTTYDLEYQKWDMINEDHRLECFKTGLLVTGMAGTDEYITIAPTHKACKLIGGTTMHRMF
eukprot:2832715-Heterocapsa_arctica.AAC.1